jgi:membrane-associated phospholipid phosphatase
MTRRWHRVGLVVLLGAAACAEPTAVPQRSAGADVGGWPTWVLPQGSAVRPATPSADIAAELDEVVRLQQARTPATDSLVRAWDGDPTSVWTRVAVERLDFYWPLLPDVRVATPVRAARAMALLHVALHDAMVAAWDAKYAHRRRAPALVDPRVRALVPVDAVPSWPSEHAAAAAASAMVLIHLLPAGDSAAIMRLARDAAESRIVAGVAFRSDVDAGWQLGRAVAQRVVDHALTDRSQDVWTGTAPAGDMLWRPTPPRRVQSPFDPLAGTWKTWVIPGGSTFRLGPPPSPTSPAFLDDLAELRRLSAGERSTAQMALARYWATDAPSLRWELFLDGELARRDWSVPHAARARAYLSAAIYDAAVACWDTKYAWWLARPITVDPTLATVFSTPPFPSYPSGHSTMSTAASLVMAELFPETAATWHHKAEEASFSRVWGGVHYRFDVTDGDSLGARVGRTVVARMRADGVAR